MVRRIDPDTAALHGQPVTIGVAGAPRLALTGQAAWVTDAERRTLLRLRY